MNTKQEIVPIAAIIIALLVIGGGSYAAKKGVEKRAEKKEKEKKEATMQAEEEKAKEEKGENEGMMQTDAMKGEKEEEKMKQNDAMMKEGEKVMEKEGDAMMPATSMVVGKKETVVIYGSQGFSPKTITIKKGEAVLFQNKTGKPISVASNVHPTHTIYSEFDQNKTDQRGKNEFRFTFEKVGTWNYHNHLNFTMTGTVVVTE